MERSIEGFSNDTVRVYRWATHGRLAHARIEHERVQVHFEFNAPLKRWMMTTRHRGRRTRGRAVRDGGTSQAQRAGDDTSLAGPTRRWGRE